MLKTTKGAPANGRGLQRLKLALMSSALLGLAATSTATAQAISFWTQPQGELLGYQDLFGEFASEFKAESGIDVSVEVINWGVAFNTWLTVAQGGAAPDCADMYWLHSYSGIGGDKYGPMPINEYRDQWPNLEEEFYPGSLQDIQWDGDFYGIPWRVDIRPQMYNTEMFAEAGLTAPPDTWDEIVEMAKALTVRDDNGNVTRWGFAAGPNNPAQTLLPYYWQAGGTILSEDGTQANIDNEAMRTALKFLQDLVWEHEVMSPESFEKGVDPLDSFASETVAMVGSTPIAWASQMEREYPELDGKWAMAVNAMGPVNRDSYSGAGYWGVLRGTDNVDACIDWIKFLSRDENMQRLSEFSGAASPRRSVMSSPYWSDSQWKVAAAETLNYGHTSQHATSVWGALASPEPGAVIYDLVYSTVIVRDDIDAAVKTAHARLQEELDRANRPQ